MSNIQTKISIFISKRDAEIYHCRAVGFTFRRTGELYNLSPERIRQICSVVAKKLNRIKTGAGSRFLDARTANSLKDYGGVETVSQLQEKTKKELLCMRGIGKIAIENIEKFLFLHGLFLKEELRIGDYFVERVDAHQNCLFKWGIKFKIKQNPPPFNILTLI
jgi:hypothetical protein|tara:strand:- start:1482 stop:1970 length:489 start_codon:yes stop_codon:yes gene_type:complete